MNRYPTVNKLGRILVHLLERGVKKIPRHSDRSVQYDVKDLSVMLRVIGILGEGFHVEKLVEQKLQVPFTDESFGHDVHPGSGGRSIDDLGSSYPSCILRLHMRRVGLGSHHAQHTILHGPCRVSQNNCL